MGTVVPIKEKGHFLENMNCRVRSENITHASCEHDSVTCIWKVRVCEFRGATKINKEVRFLLHSAATVAPAAVGRVASRGRRDLWKV